MKRSVARVQVYEETFAKIQDMVRAIAPGACALVPANTSRARHLRRQSGISSLKELTKVFIEE